jgi:hypothetical protein
MPRWGQVGLQKGGEATIPVGTRQPGGDAESVMLVAGAVLPGETAVPQRRVDLGDGRPPSSIGPDARFPLTLGHRRALTAGMVGGLVVPQSPSGQWLIALRPHRERDAIAHTSASALNLLGVFNRQHRNVSVNPGKTYAPAIFAKESDAAGISSRALEGALSRLLADDKIMSRSRGRHPVNVADLSPGHPDESGLPTPFQRLPTGCNPLALEQGTIIATTSSAVRALSSSSLRASNPFRRRSPRR